MGAGQLTIDLKAIQRNWSALDALSADTVETGAVVKADGYGLSARKVATHLAESGVQTFFVATAEEGAEIRGAVGDNADIFVFSGHMPQDTTLLKTHGLIAVLNAPEQVTRHFSDAAGYPFGVQLDTGMSRLGMEPGDWQALSTELMLAGPRLVMSHMACADDADHPMNAQQLRAFHDLTDGIASRRSLSATGGILLGPEYHFEVTRPGIGLYGGFPFETAKTVVQLDVPVIQTRVVQPFQTVGYGCTWDAKVESCIATIAAGYADGLIRAMGGKAQVFAGTTPCPVVGRVSMDLITVDVTGLDQVPDHLTVLGPDQSIDDLAGAADTIGYEILTSLGARYQRHYA
jgi:alanine racemase